MRADVLLNGYQASLHEDEKGAGNCIAARMNLMPLNCTFKNG